MNEIISASLFTSVIKHLLELRLRETSCVKAIENVASDITAEQDWLLLNNCDLLVVPSWIDSLNINSIEIDSSLAWLIELFNQGDDRRFATT